MEGDVQLCFAHLLARNMPLSTSRTRFGKFWIGHFDSNRPNVDPPYKGPVASLYPIRKYMWKWLKSECRKGVYTVIQVLHKGATDGITAEERIAQEFRMAMQLAPPQASVVLSGGMDMRL